MVTGVALLPLVACWITGGRPLLTDALWNAKSGMQALPSFGMGVAQFMEALFRAISATAKGRAGANE
jgi:hypothetical protein